MRGMRSFPKNARLRPLLLIALLLLVGAPALHALDTVYVVRHGEKVEPWQGDHDFQPLSDDGQARAARLVTLLGDARISGLYSSATVRTFSTAVPLSRSLGVPIVADNATIDDQSLPAFVETLRARHEGDTAILIVGHSNTIAMILGAFGADRSCAERLGIDERGFIEGYDGLWQIELVHPGCAGMKRRTQPTQDDDGADSDSDASSDH